mmetsp:Transcript_69387/g.159373  ORF Transcript_69387/g.159373 Transcript_69387/m.159373 type:complete len:208 (-) Transcript_69387:1200-1823(-)
MHIKPPVLLSPGGRPGKCRHPLQRVVALVHIQSHLLPQLALLPDALQDHLLLGQLPLGLRRLRLGPCLAGCGLRRRRLSSYLRLRRHRGGEPRQGREVGRRLRLGLRLRRRGLGPGRRVEVRLRGRRGLGGRYRRRIFHLRVLLNRHRNIEQPLLLPELALRVQVDSHVGLAFVLHLVSLQARGQLFHAVIASGLDVLQFLLWAIFL